MSAIKENPDLGTCASVIFDQWEHRPYVIAGGAGRSSGLRDLHDEIAVIEEYSGDLIDEINIVSEWTLHVALYALQNPTPENIARALSLIGTSGDVEQHCDDDTLRPLPVPEPNGWTP